MTLHAGVIEPRLGSDVVDAEAKPKGRAKELRWRQVGQRHRGKESPHNRPRCADAQRDGNGSDHPFPMKNNIAMTDKPEGFPQTKEKKTAKADGGGSLGNSTDWIAQDHRKCRSAGDDSCNQHNPTRDSV